jgi:hypothetical protein
MELSMGLLLKFYKKSSKMIKTYHQRKTPLKSMAEQFLNKLKNNENSSYYYKIIQKLQSIVSPTKPVGHLTIICNIFNGTNAGNSLILIDFKNAKIHKGKNTFFQ